MGRLFTTKKMLIIALSLALYACGDGNGDVDSTVNDVPNSSERETSKVSFNTDGTSFEGPSSIPGGWVKITLVNSSTRQNHLSMIRLFENKTLADLTSAVQQAPDGPLPNWAIPVGGPGPVESGSSGSTTLNLAIGDYALLRYETDTNFISRLDTAGIQLLSVTSEGIGLEPTATVLINMFDFGYVANPVKKAGVTLMPPIDAGNHVVKITNDGPDIHELRIVEIPTGKSVVDSDGWVIGQDKRRGGSPRVRVLPDEKKGNRPTGPPVGKAVGGTTAIMPGHTVYMDLSLSQGNYFLYCSLLDIGTDQSHVFRRMIHEFQARTPLIR